MTSFISLKMSKDKEVDKIKRSKYFPEEFLEDFVSDYDELIKEQEKEKDDLKAELWGFKTRLNEIFDSLSFEQKYKPHQHIER